MEMTVEQLQEVVREVIREAGLVQAAPEGSAGEFKHALFAGATNARRAETMSLGVGKLIRALAAAKGDPERAAAWTKKHFHDEAIEKALLASDGGSGGFTVPEDYTTSVIEFLRPASAIRRMNPIIVPMPNGNMTLPKQTGGAAASYIGESSNLPATGASFGQVKLSWKKLGALVPVSNDLLRFNAVGVDTIVRDDLVAALGQRSDLAFLRDDGTDFTPTGLLHWVIAANTFGANGTVNLANVTTDLATMVLKLRSSNCRMLRVGWIMSPRTEMYLMTVRDGNGNFAFRDEMLRGTLWTFPFAVTTQIPENLGGGTNETELYLADFADVVIGEAQTLLVDVSTEAAYHDGSAVVAAFSRDETVIRAILLHDLGMRHNGSLAVLTAVKWGA